MTQQERKTIQLTINLPPRRTWIIIGVLIGLALGGAFVATAGDGNRATNNVASGPLVVPYDGFLMLDSAPLDQESVPMTFTLFNASEGGTAVYAENQTVDVHGGRFSVAIGGGQVINGNLTDEILDAERLFLQITVDGVALSGRQAIEPTPFAAWAANSADMRINGKAFVGNAAPTGSQLQIANNVAEDGAINELADYQLTLFEDGTPAGSYGMGIQTRTMWFHVPGVASYKFYGSGNTRMTLNDTELNLNLNDLRLGTGGNVFLRASGESLIINPNANATQGVTIDSLANIDGNLTFQGTNRVISSLREVSGNGILVLREQSGGGATMTFDGDVIASSTLATTFVRGNSNLSLRTLSASGPLLVLNQTSDSFEFSGGNLDIQTSANIDGSLTLGGNLAMGANDITTDDITAGDISATKVLVTGTKRTVTGSGGGGKQVARDSSASCGNSPVTGVTLHDPGGLAHVEIRVTCGPN